MKIYDLLLPCEREGLSFRLSNYGDELTVLDDECSASECEAFHCLWSIIAHEIRLFMQLIICSLMTSVVET